MEHVNFRATFPVTAAELFAWHERSGAFERLNPPWSPVRVVKRLGEGIADGVQVTVAVPPIGVRWTLRHLDYEFGKRFADEQVRGPFRSWRHDHIFQDHGDGSSTLEDRISFELPLGLGGSLVRSKLEALFAHRYRILAEDLKRHQSNPALRVAVTGSSGMIGSALVPFLTSGGHTALRVVRRTPDNENEIYWNAESPSGERQAPWENLDAVVHLAGEPIFAKRWTEQQKSRIKESRMRGTENLCRLLTSLKQPPKVLISMSGINYYGTSAEGSLTETAEPGEGFLAEVAQAWEAATAAAELAGIRVVKLRLGVVLSPIGGALKLMLPAFRMGLGGPIGSGEQRMSWISLDDVVYLINHCLLNESIKGAINAVSPQSCTNRTFVNQLAGVLHRPALVPTPAGALGLVLGDVVDETIMSSLDVVPSSKVLETGFEYADAHLEPALRRLLGLVKAPFGG